MKSLKAPYLNAYGTWNVTTEGDVEGRSIKHLGTYTGYVDEIALYLADQAYYALRFSTTELVEVYKPTRNEVSVSFDIESGTWNDADDRLADMKILFKDRPVTISRGQYYASVKISTDKEIVKELEDMSKEELINIIKNK